MEFILFSKKKQVEITERNIIKFSWKRFFFILYGCETIVAFRRLYIDSIFLPFRTWNEKHFKDGKWKGN